MNIYEKINEIRKAVEYIQKDKDVSAGSGGNYKAVTHDAVTAILRKHLIEHGIICIPNLVSSESKEKEEGAKQFRYSATYSFDFVNAETPTEKITIVIEAHAMDNGDKAPGKAISYAKKYAVLKLFEIETGEDEESRYQTEDVDSEQLVKIIMSASSIEELKTLFATTTKSCGKDDAALEAVIKAKDAKKKELSGGTKD